jgi:WD40 repeat protein
VDDIICVVFSNHFSVLATGSSKGVVSLWDLEQFKIVAVSKQTSFSITCMVFTEDYPLLISCAIDGIIYISEVKRDKESTYIICLARFIHLNFSKEIPSNLGVTAALIKIFERETLFETATKNAFSVEHQQHLSEFLYEGTLV